MSVARQECLMKTGAEKLEGEGRRLPIGNLKGGSRLATSRGQLTYKDEVEQ